MGHLIEFLSVDSLKYAMQLLSFTIKSNTNIAYCSSYSLVFLFIQNTKNEIGTIWGHYLFQLHFIVELHAVK